MCASVDVYSVVPEVLSTSSHILTVSIFLWFQISKNINLKAFLDRQLFHFMEANASCRTWPLFGDYARFAFSFFYKWILRKAVIVSIWLLLL